MKKILYLAAFALCFMSCSDDDNGGDNNPRKDVNMPEASKPMMEQSADFAFKLFQTMGNETNEANEQVVLSPLSAAYALGMAANGAAGDTQKEILSAMGASDIDLEDVNNYYKTLLAELPKLDKRCRMEFANSIWTAKSLGILPSFQQLLNASYNAETAEYDFSKGPKEINDWCSQKTHGLIPEMYGENELSESTQAVLVNALYFKGAWKMPFPKEDSFNGKFQNYDRTESRVGYMVSDFNSYCYRNDIYTAVNLSFGNEAYSMQVVLPHKNKTIDECTASLSAKEWLEWDKSVKMRVNLRMPKFKIEDELDLKSSLNLLGMNLAFSNNADFSNMTSLPFYFDGARQKTLFSIDEEGAEAASTTVMDGYLYDGMGISLEITRPFLFILKENSTNTILFIGKIAKF